MLSIEIGIVIFAVIMVVIFAFMLNPPTQIIEKINKKNEK